MGDLDLLKSIGNDTALERADTKLCTQNSRNLICQGDEKQNEDRYENSKQAESDEQFFSQHTKGIPQHVAHRKFEKNYNYEMAKKRLEACKDLTYLQCLPPDITTRIWGNITSKLLGGNHYLKNLLEVTLSRIHFECAKERHLII